MTGESFAIDRWAVTRLPTPFPIGKDEGVCGALGVSNFPQAIIRVFFFRTLKRY